MSSKAKFWISYPGSSHSPALDEIPADVQEMQSLLEPHIPDGIQVRQIVSHPREPHYRGMTIFSSCGIVSVKRQEETPESQAKWLIELMGHISDNLSAEEQKAEEAYEKLLAYMERGDVRAC